MQVASREEAVALLQAHQAAVQSDVVADLEKKKKAAPGQYQSWSQDDCKRHIRDEVEKRMASDVGAAGGGGARRECGRSVGEG